VPRKRAVGIRKHAADYHQKVPLIYVRCRQTRDLGGSSDAVETGSEHMQEETPAFKKREGKHQNHSTKEIQNMPKISKPRRMAWGSLQQKVEKNIRERRVKVNLTIWEKRPTMYQIDEAKTRGTDLHFLS